VSAAQPAPSEPLPAALLLAAPARCLLEELLEHCLAPIAAEAEVERVPAAAFAREKKEDSSLATVVLTRLASASLFGVRRVLVVLNGQELLRDASIQAWVEKPAARAHLVVTAQRSPKDGPPSVKAGLPVKTIFEPGPRSPLELRRFLERRLKSRGASATPAALDALLEHAGTSLDALDAELEKLSLYRIGESVDAAHVDELCGHTAGRDFDQLWQALKAGRAGEALALLEAMAREGLVLFGGGRAFGAAAVAAVLLPLLLARIRRAAAVSAQGEKLAAAVAGALGMKPGYVHYLREDARALGPRLARWPSAALAAEVKQKRSGAASDAEILEALVVELARA
jgi:DNA polymerase-3 subunit delta